MEAIVFDANTLELKHTTSYPIPKLVKDTDVIIRVEYSGVCGTDLHIIEGHHPATKERPIILGHEFSGEVHEVGKNSVFKKGQKVVIDPNGPCNLCDNCRRAEYQHCNSVGVKNNIGTFSDGGWAQYMKVAQHQVYLLPDEITTEQGGLCEPYSCVAHGFDRASLKVGDKILIVGAGMIGILWVTVLHQHGHRDVTITEINKVRLDGIKKLDTGYRLVTPDVLEKEMELFDVIIDCTEMSFSELEKMPSCVISLAKTAPKTRKSEIRHRFMCVGKVMEINFNYLQHGGKYVLFGCCPPSHRVSVNPFQIYDKELTIIGVKINPYSFLNAIGWLQAMGSRYLNYDKMGVKVYSLSDYKKALADLKAGSISKAMFKIC